MWVSQRPSLQSKESGQRGKDITKRSEIGKKHPKKDSQATKEAGIRNELALSEKKKSNLEIGSPWKGPSNKNNKDVSQLRIEL